MTTQSKQRVRARKFRQLLIQRGIVVRQSCRSQDMTAHLKLLLEEVKLTRTALIEDYDLQDKAL